MTLPWFLAEIQQMKEKKLQIFIVKKNVTHQIFVFLGFLLFVTDSLHINKSCMHKKWSFEYYKSMAQMNRKLEGGILILTLSFLYIYAMDL